MGEPVTGIEAALLARGPAWQVATVCLFKRELTVGEVAAALEQRLQYAPRFRQIVKPGVLSGLWIDDPRFVMDRQVRELPLSDLGHTAALVEGLLSEPLATDRPLWEAAVLTGVRGRTGLVLRLNPALVDGYDNIHVLQESLDDFESAVDLHVPEWTPRPETDLGTDAMTAVMRNLREPGRLFSRVAAGFGGAVDTAVRSAVPGQARPQLVGATRVPLARVRQVRQRFRCTAHDVLLTLAAGGYADWLVASGLPVTDKVAQVPLATKEPDVLESAIGARIAPQWIGLPLTVPLAADRLTLIASLTRARIDSGRLVPVADLEGLAGFAPPTLAAVAAGTTIAGRPHDILISNVPGPYGQKFLGPASLVSCHQVVGLTGPAEASVTITTYAGTAGFGIVVPEVPAAFAQGITRTLAELEGTAA